MKKLKADWKCDWCGFEYTDTKDAARPAGWRAVNVQVSNEPTAIERHFCCQEHLNSWREAAGL